MNKEIAALTEAITRIENKIDLLNSRVNNLELRVTKLEENKKSSSSKSFSIQNRYSTSTNNNDIVNMGQITFSSDDSKNYNNNLFQINKN